MALSNVLKPMQLCYFDSERAEMIMLPFWIRNHSDLAVVHNQIRMNRWGNIPFNDFWFRSWNNYAFGSTNEAEVSCDLRVFQNPTATPTTSPSYAILRNNLLS
jgi:hypothetical protein